MCISSTDEDILNPIILVQFPSMFKKLIGSAMCIKIPQTWVWFESFMTFYTFFSRKTS